eukprot:TRINITY_DN1069_c0_g2_i1.p1 TRINITY_DN1069_c0_g2~~TRINITY_DN1069_c0_g2_i1.p1  ORF type:complete len:475 (+),score=143.72 TRINITY_DN1069_c0_g2_i1:257-1681(+)
MGMRARKPEAEDAAGRNLDMGSLKAVSWKEVAKHNTVDDCWITVDDVAYDLTDWTHKHPGGQELMLTFAGREGTQAFNSYHCLSIEKARNTLKNFAVARVTDTEFQQYPKDNKIYTAITERVKEYFAKTKKDPKDWRPGFFHFMLMMSIAAVSLSFTTGYFSSPAVVQIFFALVFGWIQALPLLHIMHDCSHGAFSHNPRMWDLFGVFTMDVYAGVSMTAWHLQHVVGHHVWTNVFEADPDLPPARKGDPRRLVDKQEQNWMYKYQHYYLPLAYGVLAMKVRMSDVQHLLLPMAGPMRVRKHSTNFYIQWVVIKTLWVLWRHVVPLYVMGVPLMWHLILFTISDMITGWYLALNFQVSHISTEADYPFGSDEFKSNVCSDEWAVSQIKTSVDYDHNNALMTWLCGALNYQTVHHLFPGISQYHYPSIAPIIMEVCKEHGVKYNVLPDFKAALFAHIEYLRVMGEKGIAVPVHMG